MNPLTLIRYALATVFVIYCLYQGYKLFDDLISTPEKVTECGTITFKGSRDQVNKHSTNVEFIMVVDFDNSGKRDMEVTASTWSSFNVNDRVCFTSEKHMASFKDGNFWSFINFCVAIITDFIIVLGSLLVMIGFIGWIFTGKNMFKEDSNHF